MADITSWLKKNLSSFEPDEYLALNATRHLGKTEQAKLFSPEIEKMRTAEGRWYEAIMYEMFLKMTLESREIKALALKGVDVPHGSRERIKLGQNGLFYSRCGDITVRGNGQDLAEFDLLFIDHNNHIGFAEVVTSASDMKEFEQEIAYKRTLLGYLFDQKEVTFLLISSFDVTNYVVGRRLVRTPRTLNIQTASCEEIKSQITQKRTGQHHTRPPRHEKFILARDIPLRHPFDYEKYHEYEKTKVFTWVSSTNGKGDRPGPEDDTGRLVKKILYGAMYPSAVRSLCRNHEFIVRGERIGYDEIMKRYSKAVLATDLPGFDPIIYLRNRRKQEYLKMVQNGDGNFKFERFTPPKVGFFLWLESLQPILGARISTSILDAFSQNGSDK
ncbi:MAG: hypothetical protein MUE45_00075 [Methanoregulaceae archaeon]|jgi:hypothetical protein|nr:hypothetical protein [Methanoregulaceae archaeon]MCU0627877.1 hypothetical protein [Methanoregulaceae archaeon]